MPVLLALLLASYASAQDNPKPESRARHGHEEVAVLGFNDGCSIAIRHFRFPRSVEGAQVDPVWGRLGTVSLDPEKRQPTVQWQLQVKEGFPYYKGYDAAAQDHLARVGYTHAGFVERIRPDPIATGRGLEPIIRSTASLRVGYAVAYASAPYALSRIHYSPLGTCAFLVFERPGWPPNVHKYQLVRVPLDARQERARAHLLNSLLLYRNHSDTYGALEEAAIAAATDPKTSENRYRHAVMLAVHGRFEEALKELREAVVLDRKWAQAAREAIEFEDLWKQERFKQALEVPAGTMPLDPL